MQRFVYLRGNEVSDTGDGHDDDDSIVSFKAPLLIFLPFLVTTITI